MQTHKTVKKNFAYHARALLTIITVSAFAILVLSHFAHASQKLTVVLDAGHGGDDTGAIATVDGKQITEKQLTLDITRKIEDALKLKGYNVVLTRADDSVVQLDKRIAYAVSKTKNAQKESVFVSLHINSNKDKSINGIETYVFNGSTNEASEALAKVENGSFRVEPKGVLKLILSDLTASANYADSVQLACRTHDSMITGLGYYGYKVRDRGVRPGLFYVLMNAPMPGILIEAGFASNSEEMNRLADSNFQKRLADRIADGIWRWNSVKVTTLARKSDATSKHMISGVMKSAVSSLCGKK